MKLKKLYVGFMSVVLSCILFLMALPYVKGEKVLFNKEEQTVAANLDEKISKNEKDELTAVSLERSLKKQDVYATDAKYIVLHDEFKALYPDNLQATIKNNTNKDIKDVQYGFVAWDKNGLPIKIKGNIDFGKSYFRGVNADAANIKAYGTFGEDKGYRIDSKIGVHSFKPFVVSYVDFEGKKWTNPKYKDFLKVYEGKRLKDIKGAKKFIFYKDKKSKLEETNKVKTDVANNIDPNQYDEISKNIKEKSKISSEALEEYIAYLQIMGLYAYLEYYEMENDIDIYSYYDLSEDHINLYTEDDFTDYEDEIDESEDDYSDDSDLNDDSSEDVSKDTYDDSYDEYTEDEAVEETIDDEYEEESEESYDESYDDSYDEENSEESYDETELTEDEYIEEENEFSDDAYEATEDDEYVEEEF
ncbi:DUF5780 domain-containing protein [Macrococcus animalis]|uniref:DUF5780 domain-containing protein n=1 Tax=Macrococcus animalis TaxID=3395467 RepID=UPI0039BE2B4F